jgi:protein-glutamine gamma-glutamyltransferase
LHRFKAGKAVPTGSVVVFCLIGLSVFVLLFKYRERLFLPREQRALSLFYRTVERDCAISFRRGLQGILEIAEATGNINAKEFANIYAGAVYRDRRLSSSEYAMLKEIAKKGFDK